MAHEEQERTIDYDLIWRGRISEGVQRSEESWRYLATCNGRWLGTILIDLEDISAVASKVGLLHSDLMAKSLSKTYRLP